ncbi:hypothetical protein [Paenibacillus sp. FSL K6-2524]
MGRNDFGKATAVVVVSEFHPLFPVFLGLFQHMMDERIEALDFNMD